MMHLAVEPEVWISGTGGNGVRERNVSLPVHLEIGARLVCAAWGFALRWSHREGFHLKSGIAHSTLDPGHRARLCSLPKRVSCSWGRLLSSALCIFPLVSSHRGGDIHIPLLFDTRRDDTY